MSKRGVIRCILSVLLIAYLAVALTYARECAKADSYKALDIIIEQTESAGFVTADDIDAELVGLRSRITALRVDSVNTLAIERAIRDMDKIEDANCVALNDGTLRLNVTPLVPVARVFDLTTGRNFYINREGKRMRASARYRIDVPVISGHFSEAVQPTRVLPVLDFLAKNKAMESLCSAIKVERNGDMVMVPRVKGHVVNLGDTADIANKFERLYAFYHRVMPVKGWEYYDTISVKWRGQVVGKRHGPAPAAPLDLDLDEAYIDDAGTMEAPADSISR